jgi:nucleotide-binding universal stress UspA family protein
MTITTIATHVRPGTPGEVERRLTPALTVAEAFGAWMATLVFAIEDDGAGEAEAAAQAEALAARRGVRGEVRARSSFAYGAGEVFADQARVSDLAVVSLDLAQGLAGRLLLSGVVFGSGRPVLVVPEAAGLARMPKKVLVGWDASPAAARAVAGALPILQRAEETVVATLSEDKALRPGQSGVELTHLLARHQVRASFASVPAGGGGALAALAGAARAQGAEMLVLGAVRHSPLHDLVFGSVTDALFQGAGGLPCLVAA